MDEPYLSVIADTLDKKIGALQRYTETMLAKGWIQKERQGRKVVYSFNPEEVWKGYSGLQKLSNDWEELDESIQYYLKFSLKYQILLVVDTTKPNPESSEAIKTVREILDQSINTVYTAEATLQELDSEGALEDMNEEEIIPVRVYLNLIKDEWTESDADSILEEMKDVSYTG
jgi:hypothetical protein